MCCCAIAVMQNTVYPILTFIAFVHHAGGIAQLTEKPPAAIYAFSGETVKFKWSYAVDDRNIDFGHYVSSPIWYYYPPNGNRSVIAVDDGLNGWKWSISQSTCPRRLLEPTVRVSKESLATLVITNVTRADSGVYEICLVLRTSPSIVNQVELVITGEAVHFTKVPLPIIFVAKGNTARFEWNYSFNNRSIEFQSKSPVLGYIDQVNQWASIASGKRVQNWAVSIDTNTCPARFLYPIRITVESPATLVIRNVTMADNGNYGCSLKGKWGLPVNSAVQLVVTDYPVITSPTVSRILMQEGSELTVPCLSRGIPIPNVTWVKVVRDTNVFVTEGLANATLSIKDLNRNKSGIYECSASNNPNEVPVSMKIEVIIIFVKEMFSYSNTVKQTYISEGKDLRLSCSANDSLSPVNITYTWIHVKGNKNLIKSQGINSADLLIRNIRRDQNGTYECQASSNQNNISVTVNITVSVTVMYKPEIDYCQSSEKNASSFPGYTIYLHCVASGVPTPNITWYGTNGVKISGITSYQGRTDLALTTTSRPDYGIYRCRAENAIGVVWHNVTVRQACRCMENDKTHYRTSTGWTIKPYIFITWMTVTGVSAITNILLLIYIKRRKRCKGTFVSEKLESDINASSENHTPMRESLNVAMDDDNRFQTHAAAYERMDMLYAYVPSVDNTRPTASHDSFSMVKGKANCKQNSFIKPRPYQGFSYDNAQRQPRASYQHLCQENRDELSISFQKNVRPADYQILKLKYHSPDYQGLYKTPKSTS